MGNWGSTERTGDQTVFGEDGQTPRLYERQLQPNQWPIIYSPSYNISFLGMEKIHPFDSGKWAKVYQFLVGEGICPGGLKLS